MGGRGQRLGTPALWGWGATVLDFPNIKKSTRAPSDSLFSKGKCRIVFLSSLFRKKFDSPDSVKPLLALLEYPGEVSQPRHGLLQVTARYEGCEGCR